MDRYKNVYILNRGGGAGAGAGAGAGTQNATCEEVCSDLTNETRSNASAVKILHCYSGSALGFGENMDPILRDNIPDEADIRCDGTLLF